MGLTVVIRRMLIIVRNIPTPKEVDQNRRQVPVMNEHLAVIDLTAAISMISNIV